MAKCKPNSSKIVFLHAFSIGHPPRLWSVYRVEDRSEEERCRRWCQSEGEARYGDPHLKVKCRIWRSDFREKKFSYSLGGGWGWYGVWRMWIKRSFLPRSTPQLLPLLFQSHLRPPLSPSPHTCGQTPPYIPLRQRRRNGWCHPGR